MNWKVAAIAILGLVGSFSAAADTDFDARIVQISQSWDHAQFEITQNDAKLTAFRQLEAETAALAQQYPHQAEPIVWEAIVESSAAGAQGGLGALSKISHARQLLENAERINPNALGDGSIYTSLGSLYYMAPGFPLSFGNRDRARQYLQHALALNPMGIDPNYFMGDFLIRQADYAHAAEFLRRAIAAPPRPGREVADQGRRRQAAALLQQALSHPQG